MGSQGSFSIYVTCLGTIYYISWDDFQFEVECGVPLIHHKQIRLSEANIDATWNWLMSFQSKRQS